MQRAPDTEMMSPQSKGGRGCNVPRIPGRCQNSPMRRPSRPHKLEREEYVGRVVAYTLTIHDKRHVFIDQASFEAMVSFLVRTAEMYSCLIPIYCFMANHVHLLAMPGHDQANTLDMIR
jgi:hypothetical protein